MLPDEWDNLPDDSTFKLRLSGTTSDCEGLAFVYMDGQQISVWSHDQLVAGRTMTLSAPHNYRVNLQITFIGAANSTVAVDAAPSASTGPLGTPYHQTTSGVKNDRDSADFWLSTAL
jgi:hypothetical protein